MCGFAVFVRDSPGAPAEADPQVEVALAGRRPDSGAHHVTDRLIVVSSRLTHRGGGASDRPYVDADGGTAVFNGAIYNLEAFRNNTGLPDVSEVQAIYLALRDHGVDALKYIDGQFAIVVAFPDGRVLVARDRFGVSPLYYGSSDAGWVIASNLRAWSAMARTGSRTNGSAPELDVTGLASILTEWAPVDGLSPYLDVHQCQAGKFLTIEHGSSTRQQSWASTAQLRNAPDAPSRVGATTTPPSDAELTDLLQRLRNSVEIRLRSATPVTCLLSGGVDSTLLGALAQENGARRGLGLYLDGDDVVRDRQQQVADTIGLGLDQHRLHAREAIHLLEEYVRTRRVPLSRLGPVGMMALARYANAIGIRAVISGEGADELFGGYDSARILAARNGALGPTSSLPWAEFGSPEFGADRGPRWARAYWRTLIALSTSSGARRGDVVSPVAEFLAPRLRHEVGRLQDAAPTPVTVEDRRGHDIRRLLASYLLTVQGDHAWSEEGVELRPAYLATPVANWALSRDPTSFITISEGKTPIRNLLRQLAAERPGLNELGFAKAAFRVDASFLLQDEQASAKLRDLVGHAPENLVQTEAIINRVDTCLTAQTCSEAESMIFLFAASLGVLAASQ